MDLQWHIKLKFKTTVHFIDQINKIVGLLNIFFQTVTIDFCPKDFLGYGSWLF